MEKTNFYEDLNEEEIKGLFVYLGLDMKGFAEFEAKVSSHQSATKFTAKKQTPGTGSNYTLTKIVLQIIDNCIYSLDQFVSEHSKDAVFFDDSKPFANLEEKSDKMTEYILGIRPKFAREIRDEKIESLIIKVGAERGELLDLQKKLEEIRQQTDEKEKELLESEAQLDALLEEKALEEKALDTRTK